MGWEIGGEEWGGELTRDAIRAEICISIRFRGSISSPQGQGSEVGITAEPAPLWRGASSSPRAPDASRAAGNGRAAANGRAASVRAVTAFAREPHNMSVRRLGEQSRILEGVAELARRLQAISRRLHVHYTMYYTVYTM